MASNSRTTACVPAPPSCVLVAAQIRGYLPRNTHHPKMLLPLPLPWPCPLDAAGSAISHGDDRFGRPQGFAAPCFARP